MNGPTDKRDLPALTGLRAIAAAWVLLLHARRLIEAAFPAAAVLKPLTERGYLGVDLFFVLSGFILAHNYGGRSTWSASERRRFWWLRLARVYPVHLATLLVVVAGVVTANLVGLTYADPSSVDPRDLLPQVLLAQAWVWAPRASWNMPSWSVSAEWAGYLLFPFVAPPIARVRSGAWALCGAMAAMVATFALLRAGGASSLDVTTRGGLVRLGGEFVAGIFLHRVYRSLEGSMVRSWLAPVALTFVLALLVAGAPDEFVALSLAVLLVGIASDPGWIGRGLGSAMVVASGQRSYALYMTHGIVLHLLEAARAPALLASDPIAVRLAYLGASLGAMLVVSDVTYRLVEEPARNLLRRARFGARVSATEA